MSFSIQISSDLVALEAGDNAPVNLEVINRGEEVDRFEVEIEGLDPEWTAVPVPIFTVGAGDKTTEKIFFKPPRTSESLAGNYPFVIKVRSLNSAESRQAQGVVQVKPYNHLSMEILPKKGYVSPIRNAEIFHASIMNLGNTEQTLQLYGSDPEDAFAFEFGQEQVSIGPGQQKDVEVRATPTSSKPFSSPRIFVFTLSARSIQIPSLVTSAQAQVEQRPVITPATLSVLFLVLLLVFVWYLARPQPPIMQTLELDPATASYTRGDMVTVRWNALHSTGVVITTPDNVVHDEGPMGTLTFQANTSGKVTAMAMEDRTPSRPVVRSFEVKEPPIVPAPSIDSFDITPKNLNVGQSFLVHYRVSNAVTIHLAPTATILVPSSEDQEVTPTQAGTTKYYLVAENGTGKSVRSKEITVRVTQASAAHIVYFDVQPRTVDPDHNQVTIQWQVTDAAHLSLSVGGAITDLQNQFTGQTSIPISQTTEIFLTAYDSQGLTVPSKRITVKMKVPPPPPTAPPTNEQTTGGDNNSTTTTGNNNPPVSTTGGG